MRKTVIFLIFILSVLTSLPVNAGDDIKQKNNELFYRGNEFYKQGKYEDALNLFLEINESGYKSGNLLFNIGNSFYRLNMTGFTILYYERAALLTPRDSDLDYNLRYLRNQTKDAVDPPVSAVSQVLFWTKSVTVNELFAIFAVINVFFWTVLMIRLFIKKEWTYYLPFIFLTLWLVSGLSWAWKTYSVKTDSRAVVIADEVSVFSGPDEREKVLFQLHAGTIVIQERKEDNWKLIKLNEKRGWVKKADIERIKPEV